MDFKIQYTDSFSRASNLTLNNKVISTPINWFAFSNIESREFQIKSYLKSNVSSFLCNVYDLKFNDKNGDRRKLVDFLKHCGLNSKIDSGGYQAMNKGIELSQFDVATIQTEINCDISIQLDHPLVPDLNEMEIKKRIDYNIKNLEILVDNFSNSLNFIPTIHGYDSKSLDYSIEKIIKVMGRKPKIVAIGSLVPLSLNASLEKKKKLVDIILYVRNKLPNSFLHILGMGGSMTYVGVFCGADSFDSAGWAQKSGFGVIQLPGVSDRFIEKHSHGRRSLNESEKIQFIDCECVACKNYSSDFSDFVGKGEDKRLLRAIHNLSLFQTEMYKMRRAIKNKIIEPFIRKRLINSKWLKLIDYAKTKMNITEKSTIDTFF